MSTYEHQLADAACVDTTHEWAVALDGPCWDLDLNEETIVIALDVTPCEPTCSATFGLLLGDMFLVQAHSTALASPLHVDLQTVVGPFERLSVRFISVVEPLVPSELRGSITLRRAA